MCACVCVCMRDHVCGADGISLLEVKSRSPSHPSWASGRTGGWQLASSGLLSALRSEVSGEKSQVVKIGDLRLLCLAGGSGHCPYLLEQGGCLLSLQSVATVPPLPPARSCPLLTVVDAWLGSLGLRVELASRWAWDPSILPGGFYLPKNSLFKSGFCGSISR